jgi:hypothetical protein
MSTHVSLCRDWVDTTTERLGLVSMHEARVRAW